MRTLTPEGEPAAVEFVLSANSSRLTIDDGRELSVPQAWFPRHLRGSPQQRNRWELIRRGKGHHWGALDEDISVAGLLAGLSDHSRTGLSAA
ncbi:MAG: DUF2442 domain-containing protein [bacterium]|nr:DUF2442 domain-containing protein [bacterium]MDE0240125.1 DUF2442 domain-containing protein [bacterium]MDE0419202.1 DUF2442 domain-containing protein [bacterium]